MNTKIDKLFEKGIEFGIEGEHEKAIDCFSKIINLNPKSAEAYYNR